MKKTFKTKLLVVMIVLAFLSVMACAKKSLATVNSANFEVKTTSITSTEVDLDVYAKNINSTGGINAFIATLNYDKTIFDTVIATDLTGQNSWWINFNPQNGSFTGLLNYMTSSDQIVCKIKLPIKSGVTFEKTNITLNGIQVTDGTGDIDVPQVSTDITALDVTKAYNSTTNAVTVTAKSDVGISAISTSGWNTADSGKTYTKVFSSNTTEAVDFTLANGVKITKSISITEIIEPKLTFTKTYNTSLNTVTVKVDSNFTMTNSKVSATSGWTLSADKLSYTKTYDANINYSTTFTFENGRSLAQAIVITEILEPQFTVTKTYDATDNTVAVAVKSNIPMQVKTGWGISEDKLTVYNRYAANGSYTETFTFLNGKTGSKVIDITEIISNAQLSVTTNYDADTNTVLVKVNSTVKFKDDLQDWSLDATGYKYQRRYRTNGVQAVTFNFEDLTNKSINITITGILTAELSSTKTYNEATNTVTVIVKSNVKMTNSKVSATSGWILSQDGLTYTKEYNLNTDYSTTFTFVDGTSKACNIVVTEVKTPSLTVEKSYNETTNAVTVIVKSNVKMTNSKVSATSGWTLSQDGLAYTKIYNQNTNYFTTFTFVDSKTLSANIVVTEIKSQEPVVIVPELSSTKTYDEAKNIVTVTIKSNVKMTNSKVSAISGWILSQDGLTYTKEYNANTNYNTTFTFTDGTSKSFNIVVTEIKDPVVVAPELTAIKAYDEAKNIVTVTVKSNVKMSNSKVSSVSGWTLSQDGLTYTKEYNVNTNYNTTFTFQDGTSKVVNIVITEIKDPVVVVPELTATKAYDEAKNIVTVTVKSNVKMSDSKVTGISGWTLSQDGLTYTKEYNANTNYNTTFKFTDGTSKVLNIVVTEIKDPVVVVPELTATKAYDEATNTVTVAVKSNVKMSDSKVTGISGWTLSQDGLTYTKKYDANTNYDTTFKFTDGTSKVFNIVVTEIKDPVVVVPELTATKAYDEATNTVTVTVKSNVKMSDSKVTGISGWTLSQDGLTYTKKYDANTNYDTTFKFTDGTSKVFNIVVTEIKDPVVVVPELTATKAYDETTNTVTITVKSNVKMSDSKVTAISGWTLSADGLTYTKKYDVNTNYNTTFKFTDGTSKIFNIVITEIK